ncbi:hypothetical protein [Paracoccus sp. ME4]|uniref:hypothetical protein n=1 Tax=Paracoccus sp. ME4 TaxID=3138066 RepID=UPI00398B47CE
MIRPTIHRGIEIRQFDVPCTPFVWSHDETDGYGTAETLAEARTQIDAHLAQLQTEDA